MSTTASRSVLRPFALVLSLLLAITGLTLPAIAAQAAPEAATASALSWGFKSSWRGYVSGFGGSAAVAHGAGASPAYTWPATSAEFDPATGHGSADFGGSVQWTVPAHGIDITMSAPRIELAGDGTGSLYWTIGADPELRGATLSSVTVGAPTSGGGNDTYPVTTAVTITAEGGAAFGGSYGAGTALDALSFTLSVASAPVAAATTTTLTASPSTTAEVGDDVTLTATVAPAAAGSVQFRDGSTALGDPVAVSAGLATFTTSALGAGEHSITAEFTSTDPAFASSASTALAYSITTSSGGGGGVPEPEPVDGLDVTDATLVWGYSGYAQSGVMGAWRFFGATGDATITTGAATGYAPAPGSTSMPASVTDPNVVQFTNGTGSVAPETGAALISYEGAFTINAYPESLGAPDETYADPVVAVSADGTGTVSFDVSFGAGVDFINGGTTPAVHLGRVLLATFSATDAGVTGFTIVPSYQGRSYDAPVGESSQMRDCPVWGSWPTAFVDALPASVRSHYYSTLSCSTQQTYKPALPLAVGYTLPEDPDYVAAEYDLGFADWGISGYLNVPASDPTSSGRANPVPAAYTAPAGYNATTRISTWGSGSGSFAADGSAEMEFEGTSVNYAPTGRAWLRFSDLHAELDAEGDGVVTALVSYANGAAGAVSSPTRTSPRIVIVELEGNGAAPVQDADSVTWTGLEGLWSDELLTFLAGGDGVAGWTYASTVTNDPSRNSGTRLPSTFQFVLGDAPVPVATAVTLGASPAETAVAGSTVTLTATVSPVIDGTVRFTDGATVLSEETVAAGSVTHELTAAVGAHAYRAEFIPANPAYATSVSSVIAQTVTAPATPTPGSLQWGVKSSFRDYVLGPIAHGAITTSAGAGAVSGGFWFPQATSSFDPATGLGSIGYRGTVQFTGHGGILNLRIADPVVRVVSSTSAVLVVATSTGPVEFATVDLGRAVRSTDATGAISYLGAPATLTAAGAAYFEGFYSAGTALDPVSFTIGSANSANAAPSSRATDSATNGPDATPPATEGVESEQTEFGEGDEVTFTASGFQPNETGILAVIYSEPTVLDEDVTADAQGVVSWTGFLPAGLTGEHTFTFQGSVDRGIVIDIAAAEAVGCPVEGAELDWGFKESFRAYIDGSIANGEWTTADGATYATPLFSWTDGSGGYDAESGDADLAFTGSVTFTGHSGVLNTTIANPRIVIDGDRAVLLLDVSGTTQDGQAVESTGVEFVTLDLAAAEAGGGGDLVAFSGIPAVLTEAGAAAFGTYEAGTAFDAIDLRITVDPACAVPAATEEEPAAELEPVSDASPLPWILGGVGLLALIAIVAFVLVRRNRTA